MTKDERLVCPYCEKSFLSNSAHSMTWTDEWQGRHPHDVFRLGCFWGALGGTVISSIIWAFMAWAFTRGLL